MIKKKLIAGLLSAAMVISLIPSMAFAESPEFLNETKSKQYSSLQAAINDAGPGDYIWTMDDYVIPSITIPKGKNVTLGLCNVTFKGTPKNGAGLYIEEGATLCLEEGANLCVDPGTNSNYEAIVKSEGKTTLKGVTAYNDHFEDNDKVRRDLIHVVKGTTTLKECLLKADGKGIALKACEESESDATNVILNNTYVEGSAEIDGASLVVNASSDGIPSEIHKDIYLGSNYKPGDIKLNSVILHQEPLAEWISENSKCIYYQGNYYWDEWQNFKIVDKTEKVTVYLKQDTPKDLVYTGSPIEVFHDTWGIHVEGGTVTDAGTYTAILKITDPYGYWWIPTEDREDKYVKFTVNPKKLDVPQVTKKLVYTGEEVTAIKSTSEYTVENGSAVEEGNYEATVTLNDTKNYTWADGTTEAKKVPYVIASINSFTKIDAPVVNENLVYNGEEQIGVVESADYTIENGKATDAGTYTATVSLVGDDTIWADGTNGPKEISYTIAKAKAYDPAVVSELTYNGKAQVAVSSGEGYTVKNGSATNAGTYTATVNLDKNYTWMDGTTEDKTYTYTIKKAVLASPSAATGLVYNGKYQTGIKNSGYYTVTSGSLTGKNAGTYSVYVRPGENYTWSDGTTVSKKVSYKIAKANPTLSTRSITVYKSKVKKKSYKYSKAVKANSTTKATFSKSSGSKYLSISKYGTLTVKKHKYSKSTKSVSIKVKAKIPSTSNYNAATKYITIKVVLK